MASEPSKKPANVPPDAVWDDDGWEFGVRDANGKKIGTWTWWREDGSIGGASEYGDGATRMTYRRNHPDGELAQSGEKDLVTDRWVGLMRWTRQAKPSPEDSFFPNMVAPPVRAFEVDLVDGYITTERCFDASGALVTDTGAPVPARPAGVPDEAFLVENDTSWLRQQRFAGNNHLRGEQSSWDRNGTLLIRRLYRDDGSLAEEDEYKNGVVWMAKRHQPNGELTQAFFHRKSDPPVISTSTLYRNNQNDRETTFFDKAGNRAFSIRMEEVNDHHLRRYDDGKLVFEAIWSSDPNTPPQKVEYYDHDGVVIVRYESTRPGHGVWKLLRRDGSSELELVEDQERDLNKYSNWDRYLRGFARYELDREHSDPDEIRENFRERYGREVAKATLAKMKASKELVAALGPDAWTKNDSAMGGAKELPTMVKGVLADDEAIAHYALERIWVEIEHQGSLYEATYRVATALATMFPLVTDRPAVHRRVFDFLRDVLDLPGIGDDKAAFAALAKAVRTSEKLLEAWAASEDTKRATDALRVLGRVGGGVQLAAQRMIDGETNAARAYATCVYVAGAPPNKRKSVLTRAFADETDPVVRFGQALLLVRVDHVTTPAVLGAIEPYLLDSSSIDEPFAELAPFLGDDVTEAILHALPKKSLEKYVETIVDALPERGSLIQISYLQTIFTVLFPKGLPKKPTLVQAKTLRVLADVIDARGNFVNHMEVYDEHGMPSDSFVLREAAEGRHAMTSRALQRSGVVTMSASSPRPVRSIGAPAKKPKKPKKPKPTKPTKPTKSGAPSKTRGSTKSKKKR